MKHHRRKAERHRMTKYDVVQRVYEVRTGYYDGKGGNKHIVTERTRSCTCSKWQTYHMPCSHAVKCFKRMVINVTDYVAGEYKVVNYLKAYSGHFHPLGNQAYWPAAPFSMVANKEHIRKLGKNKLTHYPNQMDFREKNYSRKCSTCKQFGHDKRSCGQNSRGCSTSGTRRVSRT
ncbi:uncharacterized protein LOC132062342 [Lycium ferocissimum]|uniref:uncharacterized protein LOC132062342 n=1 Tax=Lycium ferocissimum TaxID=112874 RepID=UPI002814B95A|nr:uncharacterized protein LOC132062342 [Lycium ferocissimum]